MNTYELFAFVLAVGIASFLSKREWKQNLLRFGLIALLMTILILARPYIKEFANGTNAALAIVFSFAVIFGVMVVMIQVGRKPKNEVER